MNTRHIVTSKGWFGGGADLNPIYPNETDTKKFHAALQACCGHHAPDYYDRFSKWADEYFWNAHRQEYRGVGGIFYDYLEGDWDKNFAFTKDVGQTFLDIYPQIVRAHKYDLYDETHVAHQLFRRGRYAEFNLLYDRGTTFGLKTGGNVEAILMSLPPRVTW
jgi:coproporphyrinogen III oxidase